MPPSAVLISKVHPSSQECVFVQLMVWLRPSKIKTSADTGAWLKKDEIGVQCRRILRKTPVRPGMLINDVREQFCIKVMDVQLTLGTSHTGFACVDEFT